MPPLVSSPQDLAVLAMHTKHLGGNVDACLVDKNNHIIHTEARVVSRNLVTEAVKLRPGQSFHVYAKTMHPQEPITAICTVVFWPPSIRPNTLLGLPVGTTPAAPYPQPETAFTYTARHTMDANYPHTQAFRTAKPCDNPAHVWAGCLGTGWFVAPKAGERNAFVQLEFKKAVREPRCEAGYSPDPLDEYYSISPVIFRFEIEVKDGQVHAPPAVIETKPIQANFDSDEELEEHASCASAGNRKVKWEE